MEKDTKSMECFVSSEGLFTNRGVEDLYIRTLSECDGYEETDNSALAVSEVIKAHYLLADFFLTEGEGIGGFGPKSLNLLISAVERQHTCFSGVSKWKNIYEKSATILYGLIMNHPFHDANKRTAYLSTVHYLYKNGYMISCTEKELEDFTVEISEKNIKKYSRYKDLAKNTDDPEIYFIAWWIKKNTRHIDRNQYLVTYRELEKILNRYGCRFDNNHDGQIDLLKEFKIIEEKRNFIFKRKIEKTEERKICRIGFPGWSKVVGKGRLKYIRNQLNLTPQHGFDSQSFFNNVDDMNSLMHLYQSALQNLAYR
ncbi:type II toxin-antitoxin system death-on-curing family toxin [Acetobacter persici]|uniref:type II toxin-antitoxin system death-on-curing family toxin n=1 Tax=Acetobacter persici TaxID=1076596 RepID=UPI0036D8F4BF